MVIVMMMLMVSGGVGFGGNAIPWQAGFGLPSACACGCLWQLPY